MAFKAFKNTVLYMMKNLKRPEGKDDSEWYETVENQAKAVMEAVKRPGEEDGDDEDWYEAVEHRASQVILEVRKTGACRDVLGGEVEWGEEEWNDVAEPLPTAQRPRRSRGRT